MMHRLDILVVEGNDRTFAQTRELLKRQNSFNTRVTVSRAVSLDSALEQLKTENFDLVLVDIPSGPERDITQSLRALQSASDRIPIVSLRPESGSLVIGDALRLKHP